LRCRRRVILDYFGDSAAIARCACDVCRGAVRPRPAAVAVAPRRAAKRERAGSSAERLDQAGELRFERLKKVRLQIARTEDLPAFCIAHDSVLRDVARAAPHTQDALAKIKGIGANKLEKFGAAFLRALREPQPL
jgi:ATP-dependent DNA helicase RecQ